MNRVAFDMVCALHGGGFKTYNNNITKRVLNLKKVISNFIYLQTILRYLKKITVIISR